MQCVLIRNENTNEIEKVFAPNGKESILFNKFMQIFDDKEKAYNNYRRIYNSDILKYWASPELSYIVELLLYNNMKKDDNILSISENFLIKELNRILDYNDINYIEAINKLFYEVINYPIYATDNNENYYINDIAINELINYQSTNQVNVTFTKDDEDIKYSISDNLRNIIYKNLDENGEPLLIDGSYIFRNSLYKAYKQSNKKKTITSKNTSYSNIEETLVSSDVKELLDLLEIKTKIPYKLINDPFTFWKARYFNNEILINTHYALPNILTDTWHEYSHPILLYLKNNNSSVFYNLYTSLKDTPEYEEILKITEEKIKKIYNGNIDNYIEELLATTIGYAANTKKPLSIRLKDFLRKLFKYIQRLLGIDIYSYINLKDLSPTTSFQDFLEMIIDPYSRFIYNKNVKELSEFEKDIILIQAEQDDFLKEIEQNIYENAPIQEEEEVIDITNETPSETVENVIAYNEEDTKEDFEIKTILLTVGEEINSKKEYISILPEEKSILKFLKTPKSEKQRDLSTKSELIFNRKIGKESVKLTSNFLKYLKENITQAIDIMTNFTDSKKLKSNLSDHEKEIIIEEFLPYFKDNINKYVKRKYNYDFESKNQKIFIKNKILAKAYEEFIHKNYYIIPIYDTKEEELLLETKKYSYNILFALTEEGKNNFQEFNDILLNTGFLVKIGHVFDIYKDGKKLINNINATGWVIRVKFRDTNDDLEKYFYYEFQSDIVDMNPFLLEVLFYENLKTNRLSRSLMAFKANLEKFGISYENDRLKYIITEIEHKINDMNLTINNLLNEVTSHEKIKRKIIKDKVKNISDLEGFLGTLTKKQFDILKRIASENDPARFEKKIKSFFKNRYNEISNLYITNINQILGKMDIIDQFTLPFIKKVIYNYKGTHTKPIYNINKTIQDIGLKIENYKKDIKKLERITWRARYLLSEEGMSMKQHIQNYIYSYIDREERFIDKNIKKHLKDIQYLNNTFFQKSLIFALLDAKKNGQTKVYFNTPEYMEKIHDAIGPYIDNTYFLSKYTEFLNPDGNINMELKEKSIEIINMIKFILLNPLLNAASYINNKSNSTVFNTIEKVKEKYIQIIEGLLFSDKNQLYKTAADIVYNSNALTLLLFNNNIFTLIEDTSEDSLILINIEKDILPSLNNGKKVIYELIQNVSNITHKINTYLLNNTKVSRKNMLLHEYKAALDNIIIKEIDNEMQQNKIPEKLDNFNVKKILIEYFTQLFIFKMSGFDIKKDFLIKINELLNNEEYINNISQIEEILFSDQIKLSAQLSYQDTLENILEIMFNKFLYKNLSIRINVNIITRIEKFLKDMLSFKKGGFITALDKIATNIDTLEEGRKPKNITYKRVNISELNTPVFEVDISNMTLDALPRFSKLDTFPDIIKETIGNILSYYNLDSYKELFYDDFSSLNMLYSIAYRIPEGYEKEQNVLLNYIQQYPIDVSIEYDITDVKDYIEQIELSKEFKSKSDNILLNKICYE